MHGVLMISGRDDHPPIAQSDCSTRILSWMVAQNHAFCQLHSPWSNTGYLAPCLISVMPSMFRTYMAAELHRNLLNDLLDGTRLLHKDEDSLGDRRRTELVGESCSVHDDDDILGWVAEAEADATSAQALQQARQAPHPCCVDVCH